MRISIIIPTLNEATTIADTVARTRSLGDCEIVVVDGGSDDGTLDWAQAADLCLTSERSRAFQQNCGARASSGDILLFLHADGWLEPGALEVIREIFQDPRTVAGCFRQSIESTRYVYRLIESGNARRVEWLSWAYGDQGITVRREVFERVGGFPAIPLMEDLCLMKQLKREGRVQLMDHRIHVNARRWRHMGPVQQTLRNWGLLVLFHCGVSPTTLARHYSQVR